MLNYYEETMPLITDEDEYKKYLIDESLPLFDKLNQIIKKGYPIQRQALLNNLDLYINNNLFTSLIQYIMAEIETWDIETILTFPKCLHNLLINNLSSINNELFNIFLKHIIISISSGNEKISKEYIFYFDKIIENYTNKFKNVGSFPYQIGDDIFEIIFSLGKFGQSPENIRLCCYLSSCMCRLVGYNEENENIQKMLNRICLLFGDLEKITERQISRELRYLIPIFKGKILEKNDIIKAIKSYLNHDWDHAIQTTTIVSLLANFEYINQEMRELIFEKIREIFEEINYEEEHKNNIIETFIDMLYNQCIEYDEKKKEKISNNYLDYELNDLINNSFQMNFIHNFLYKDKVDPLLINNFHKIAIIFEHSSLFNYNIDSNSNKISSCLHNFNNDENMCIDYIFFHIFIKLFSKNSNEQLGTPEPDLLKNEPLNESLKKQFLIKLSEMIPSLNNLDYTRYLYEKISSLFKKDSITFLLKIYEKEFTSNNFSKKYNYLYKLLYSIIDKGYKNMMKINSNFNKNIHLNTTGTNNNSNPQILLLNNNNYFFKLFNYILESIFSLYNNSPKSISCQMHILIAKTFQKIIKLIHKYYKPYSLNSKDKVSIDKIFDNIYNNYLYNIIKNEEIGNHIKIEYMNVIPYLILYGSNRQSYYNFIEDEIIKSKKFFTRRCSINFIEKCLNLFSFKLFSKLNFMEIIYYLFSDENNIISTSMMEKFLKHYKKIDIYSNNSCNKICSILSIIDRKNKNNVSTNNFDIEKNRLIKKIMNTINKNENKKEMKKKFYFINNDEELDEEKEIKAKETKLIKKENEILGKLYQTISLLITLNYSNKEKEEKKFDIESKNEKSNNKENDEINSSSQKERMRKREMVFEKSISNILQSINAKTTSKKILPKLKTFQRKNSLNTRHPFVINLFNNNNNFVNNNNQNQNQKVQKSLNISKIMVMIKEKTPEKRNHLRSINNRLPSANVTKIKEFFSINTNKSTNIKPKQILLFKNKIENNNYLDDANYQIIQINGLNNSGILSNIVYSGKDFLKDIINNDLKNNQEYKENKLNRSCKKVSFFLKNRMKGIKLRKEGYLNVNNKISINANISEVNKSYK